MDTETEKREERREACRVHTLKIHDLEKVVFGNGRKGLPERVVKLEVLMWVVIALLLGNGGLILWRL